MGEQWQSLLVGVPELEDSRSEEESRIYAQTPEVDSPATGFSAPGHVQAEQVHQQVHLRARVRKWV
jgi:hypothetical protein